jgi:hypothetical protein
MKDECVHLFKVFVLVVLFLVNDTFCKHFLRKFGDIVSWVIIHLLYYSYFLLISAILVSNELIILC